MTTTTTIRCIRCAALGALLFTACSPGGAPVTMPPPPPMGDAGPPPMGDAGPDMEVFCADADGDTYEDSACGGLDCDDGDARVHPGVAESCDGVDQDCDGIVDETADADCGGATNGRLACVSAACVLDSCDVGYEDCDGDESNGCEVELASDADHCGACGAVCDGICTAGACVPVVESLVQVSAGEMHTCGVRGDGALFCWGYNGDGQVGTTTPGDIPVPLRVVTTFDATRVVAGALHTCAIDDAAGLWCWGYNTYGQVGPVEGSSIMAPVLVLEGVVDVALGDRHTCALTDASEVHCWGRNNHGQLGAGAGADRSTPLAVHGLSRPVALASHLGDHTCALEESGALRCWGRNHYGQLGNGTTEGAVTPVLVGGLSGAVQELVAGELHTCARTDSATYCWGANGGGQLGDGGTDNASAPVEVADLPATSIDQIAAGTGHGCALSAAGRVSCWGWNGQGQIGTGSREERQPLPIELASLSNISQIALGSLHACALTTTGELYCWGAGSNGRLGDGMKVDHDTPTAAGPF